MRRNPPPSTRGIPKACFWQLSLPATMTDVGDLLTQIGVDPGYALRHARRGVCYFGPGDDVEPALVPDHERHPAEE